MADETNGNYKKGQDMGMLKADVNNLQKDMSSIMTNHLPHLQQGLDSLNNKVDNIHVTVARYAGGVAMLVFIIQMASLYITRK